VADPTISTRGLTKRYGERAVVDNLDLEVRAGEVFGLLGPNGAGKTTTILMLLGLVEPSEGEIMVLGLDPIRHPLEVKSRVGYLPDAVGFYDSMSGRENLRFTARLNQVDVSERENRMERLLGDVGLTDAADQTTGTYSRGMRQRLGIADALVKGPDILILDEPTTAIDPEGVAEMLALIRDLADDRKVTILLSSHLLHQVQAICDRVAIFVRGKVVATGAPHQLALKGGGPERLEVRIDAENPRIEAALSGVDFVKKFIPSRRPGTFDLEVDHGSTPQLVERLVAAGLPVLAIKRLSEELDEVYRQYFTHEEARIGA
jgi:ABC-2 type transport system ATP-binding protein